MNVKSAIESVLLIHGEPLATSRLAKLVGAPKKEVDAALRALADEYRERGIVLIQNGEEWQLATNPKNREVIERLSQGEFSGELSRPGLEVLAIVAYNGPVSRSAIDYLRGVDSSFTLRSLLLRGLVARDENPKDRRSYLYRISTEFLKHLGLSSHRELPSFTELRAHAEEVEITGDRERP